MKSYVVGGAVRDRLLGLEVADRDHVVVGATVDEMLAAGYKPVGRDFPVFLHPTTHEEYALARTERKVAPGYTGFVFHADPSVTLEADLERRDLTINAIAEDEVTGRLIDPFGGRRDLAARVFRHVGPAFVEDPVRVLRIARFAARFPDFRIADETRTLMRAMARRGEIDALVPERVWQEISRGLMEHRPSRMIVTLREADALARLVPELEAAFDTAGEPMLLALDRAAEADSALEVRFAIFLQPLGCGALAERAVEAVSRRLAVPRGVREVASAVSRERDPLVAAIEELTAVDASDRLVTSLERCDAFRRPSRFMLVAEAVAQTIQNATDRGRFDEVVSRLLKVLGTIPAGEIAREAGYDPPLIARRLGAARSAAVASVLGTFVTPG